MSKLIDLKGMRFGKLLALEKIEPRPDGVTRWMCQCDCGNTCVVYSRALRNGAQKSCGCGKLKDRTGQRFGRLVAIERSDRYVVTVNGGKKYMWKCLCDCGEVVYRLPEKLRYDAYCACDKCASDDAVMAMIKPVHFVEGTQINKIKSKKPLITSKSGIRGVFLNRKTGKWRAMLKFQGVAHYLGEYDDIEEAKEARLQAEEKYFDPFIKKYS